MGTNKTQNKNALERVEQVSSCAGKLACAETIGRSWGCVKLEVKAEMQRMAEPTDSQYWKQCRDIASSEKCASYPSHESKGAPEYSKHVCAQLSRHVDLLLCSNLSTVQFTT